MIALACFALGLLAGSVGAWLARDWTCWHGVRCYNLPNRNREGKYRGRYQSS